MKHTPKTPEPTSQPAQHTPLPWTYDETWALIMGDHGAEVAAVHAAQPNDQAKRASPSVARVNAEFICLAVNSHADLIQALRECLPFFTDAHCLKSVKWTSAREQARAAIAKAERGEV